MGIFTILLPHRCHPVALIIKEIFAKNPKFLLKLIYHFCLIFFYQNIQKLIFEKAKGEDFSVGDNLNEFVKLNAEDQQQIVAHYNH